jgi:hypothetical protein
MQISKQGNPWTLLLLWQSFPAKMPHLHILFSENDPFLWVENLSNSQSSKNQARYIEKNKLVGG